MCTNPTLIRNPNFGLSHIGLNYMKDCSSKYLRVPCGHCPECIAVRQMSIVQRMNLEFKFNHLLFVMLSYRNEMLPTVVTSEGWKLHYADWHDLDSMFKRLRKRNAFGRPFRYLAVSEFGEMGHRPHFHIILILKKLPDDDQFTPMNLRSLVFDRVLAEWRRNVARRTLKKDSKNGLRHAGDLVPDNVHPDYRPLLEYHRRVTRFGVEANYTVEYIRPLSIFSTEDAVSFYISKYVMKADPWVNRLRIALELNHDEDEFKEIWRLVAPKCKWSLGFGVNGWPKPFPYQHVDYDTGEIEDRVKYVSSPDPEALQFVHSIVEKSVPNGSPQYLAENGAVYPLSRYYYRFGDIIDPDLAKRFFLGSEKERNNGVVFFDKSLDDVNRSYEQFNKNQSLIHNNSKL